MAYDVSRCALLFFFKRKADIKGLKEFFGFAVVAVEQKITPMSSRAGKLFPLFFR